VLNALFSDRARPWLALVCGVWLVLMGARYGHYSVAKPVGFRYCLDHLEQCQGRTILLPLWRVTEVHDGGYALYKITGPIPVEGDSSGLSLGDTISAVTTFDADRQLLVEQSRKVHHLRRAKVWLGVIGLVLSLGLIVGGFRLREGRVVARG
jgi:hypothetical protein